MGYRPTIICEGDEMEFGKFYGYAKLDGLESIKWLINHGKVDDPHVEFELFVYGPEIRFSAEEFREFIRLYEKDINTIDAKDSLVTYPENYKLSDTWDKFDDIFNNDKPKIIAWG